MKMLYAIIRTSWVFAFSVSAMVMVGAASGPAHAGINGISGTSFTFTAGAGEVSVADGGAIHFWGYHAAGANPANVPQYPGPTLILNQNQEVSITLTSNLPYGQCTSMVFPGHAVSTAGGDRDGLLTRETCPGGAAVSYTFTPTEPGTYTYYSGTQMELQVEMGLVGAIIVRPAMGDNYAYNHSDTAFDHEYLFLLTSMDTMIHQLAEQNRFGEIDMTDRWPVYWFINGRTAPDDMVDPFVTWLPHQPYNCMPRMVPGQKILVRIIGGDQDQHPLHLHGNHYYEIARDGRMLASGPVSGPDLQRGRFTTLSVPGQTVDAIFGWTGEKLGWDIYGSPADGQPEHVCIDTVNNVTGAPGPDGYADPGSDYPWEWCNDHYGPCIDGNSDGYDDATGERCKNGYTKTMPVVLPEKQDLVFGGWWSGSPFMGGSEPLPPGEGGLNPYGGFFFMWHSHSEKELTNFDIFPGGMMTMMVVEPPGTPID
jgi:manganese oxidase